MKTQIITKTLNEIRKNLQTNAIRQLFDKNCPKKLNELVEQASFPIV